MPRPGTRPDGKNKDSDRPGDPNGASETRRGSGARRHRLPGQRAGSGNEHATETSGQTEDDADARERRRDALWGLAILVLAAVLVGLLFWAL